MATNRGNDLMRPLDCYSSGKSIWKSWLTLLIVSLRKSTNGTIREARYFVLKFINQNCSNTHLQIIYNRISI